MTTERRRLDHILVERGLAQSRSRAQAMIAAGRVTSAGTVQDKPGRVVPADLPLEIAGPAHPWVSRAGVKLAAALDHFAIDPAGTVALDIGASTGGFTEVLLARGAARVHAVDVGHDQLAPTLRADPRVVVLERLNARHLSARDIPQPVDLIVCDASFIGLETILPASLALTRAGTRLIALIKPQFEVGRDHIGKGGIVRDPALHDAVCRRIAAWLAGRPGWSVMGLIDSPLPGSDGNKEFLIAAARDP